MGHHKFDTSVAMLVAAQIHKVSNPQVALLLAGEWLMRIIRPGLMVRNNHSEEGLSFETLALEKDLSTPRSTCRTSTVAAHIALPLPAWRNSSCLRRLPIRTPRQALLAGSEAIGGPHGNPHARTSFRAP